MESRHVGWIDSSVYGFCFCAASLPRHNLTSWPLCQSVYHREPNCAGSDSTETSHTWQPIPTETTQKLEFVVPLCNAVTGYPWLTDWCEARLCAGTRALHAKKHKGKQRLTPLEYCTISLNVWRQVKFPSYSMLCFIRDWNKTVSFCWKRMKYTHTDLALFMLLFFAWVLTV